MRLSIPWLAVDLLALRWIEEAAHGLEPHPREQPGSALPQILLHARLPGAGRFKNLER